ncbi:MAG: CHAT domain-containing protein [Ignavibacteria bacterium]|nr:CHAT domain-containing protein [Ignavibacteria bacterium]
MQTRAPQLLLLLVGLPLLTSAQQEIYVQSLHRTSAFSSAIRIGTSSRQTGIIAVASIERSIKLYDAATLTEQGSLTGLDQPVTAFTLSRDGSLLFLAKADGSVASWRVHDRSYGKEFNAHATGILALAELPSGLLASAAIDRTVKALDPAGGRILSSITIQKDDIVTLAGHPSGKMVIIGTAGGWVRTLAVPQLEEGKRFDARGKITALALHPDGNSVAVGGLDGSVRLWNLEASTLQAAVADRKGPITALTFDPRGRWLVAASADSTLNIFDARSGAKVKSIAENDAYFTVASFVGEEVLLAGTSKGVLETWRVLEAPPDTDPPAIALTKPPASQDGIRVSREMYEIQGTVRDRSGIQGISIDRGVGGIEVTDAAPPDSVQGWVTKLFRVTVRLDSIGINTFELRALDAFGNIARRTVRITRLSSDQVVEVISPANNFETDKTSVQLQFKAWCVVASYKAHVNLIEMVNRSDIREKREGDVFTEEIPLVIGYNQIELTATSATGEKFSKTLGVNRKLFGAISAGPGAKLAPKERGPGPQRWAVVVGISEYTHRGIPALKYAESDAQAFAEFLKKPEGGGFEPDHMRILLNNDATLENLKEALIDFLSHAIDKDLVIIFFAGHGAPDPARPMNLYLLTHDADPSRLGTTAFPMWDIQTVLARHITAKKIVVFSDACHSGGISADFAARGVNVTESNLINQYLADLARTKDGIVVFTASAAGEVSQEIPELAHGVFTYYLLEGMKGQADLNNDYTVTINELMQYVEEQVKRRTKGAQNPTRSQTAYDKDLTISLIAH